MTCSEPPSARPLRPRCVTRVTHRPIARRQGPGARARVARPISPGTSGREACRSRDFMARAERGVEMAETPVPTSSPAPRTVAPSTSVDASSEVEGRLRSKQTLRIDGRVKGEVECEKTVLVGETAAVFATHRRRRGADRGRRRGRHRGAPQDHAPADGGGDGRPHHAGDRDRGGREAEGPDRDRRTDAEPAMDAAVEPELARTRRRRRRSAKPATADPKPDEAPSPQPRAHFRVARATTAAAAASRSVWRAPCGTRRAGPAASTGCRSPTGRSGPWPAGRWRGLSGWWSSRAVSTRCRRAAGAQRIADLEIAVRALVGEVGDQDLRVLEEGDDLAVEQAALVVPVDPQGHQPAVLDRGAIARS